MMLTKKTIIVLLTVLIPALVGAQLKDQQRSSIFKPSDLVKKSSGIFGKLLDPSKFHMSQSYSISFFTFGDRAINEGMYLNTMSYQISNPLFAQVQIGYMHQPLGKWGNSANPNGTLFLRRASVQYQPSENMKLYFDYESVPYSSMYSPSNYWMRE